MTDTMGFFKGIFTGNFNEEEQQEQEQDPNAQTTEESSEESASPTTSSDEDSEEEKAKKKQREAYQSRSDSGRAGFTLHQGDIKETHTYDKIFSTSWSSDYEGMESSGSITIPFHKEDLQYIYKGVRCLLKTKRFKYDVNDEQIQIDDSEGYLCFITDVNISDNKLELSLNGYEKLLEQENILSFSNQRRSTILEEVIKMAGLVPVVDATGLPDELINWSTEQNSKEDEQSGGGATSIEESTELNDKMDTHELSAEHRDTSAMSEGYIPDDMDSKTKYLKAIGKTGTNYANYVKGSKNICDMISKLRSKWKYGGYANSKWKDAEDCFDHINAVNCADSAKLVKCCCDVCGFPCAILHNKQGSNGHYFNVVKNNGKWYTVDLCFASHKGQAGSTNTLGC